MARKFFRSLSLLMIFTLAIFGTAAAKSAAEITNISAYEADENTLRVEISYTGKLAAENVTIRPTGNIFSIVLGDTTPGRISKIAGTKIDGSSFVKKITVKEAEKNNTRIRLILASGVDEDGYRVTLQPANRADKIPARVVVDIYKPSTPADEDFDDEDKDATGFKVGDKVIVIDAGHGGSDVGATGSTGLTEKEVTLAVALKTEKILKKEGMKVVMTRRTDVDVASANASNTAELQARVDKIPPQANLFISIHCNAFSNPKSHGMETFYNTAESKRLAQLLNDELAKFGGLTNRGVKAANFYVIKHANCPASLIELAFITNPEEEKLLASDKYQKKLAGAIATAVKKFFLN